MFRKRQNFCSFCDGNFHVCDVNSSTSHEQLNTDFKGDGRAVGLTEDEDKLRRWMVCRPEVTRCFGEYEAASVLTKIKSTEFRHHEETPSFQRKFCDHVSSIKTEIEKLGNPSYRRTTS